MMRIESVASQPDRAGMQLVRFSDGTIMRLYKQTMQDFGIYQGLELSDDAFAELKASAEEMSAKMRAVRIVSASSVSKKELEYRLVQKGEDPQQAHNAVAWMQQLQLIDDAQTAYQIVQRCISKGYGIARAKQALYEKKIPKSYWDDALEGYPEQSAYIVSYLTDKLTDTSDCKAVKKAVDALIRKGHTYSTIRSALDQLKVDTEEFPEE